MGEDTPRKYVRFDEVTTYLLYGTHEFDKVPQYRKPGMTVHPCLCDNGALYYAVLQSVLNLRIGVRFFHTPPIVFGYADGIRMYVIVMNRFGPTDRTQKCLYEQAIGELFPSCAKGGKRSFVNRYFAAYDELAYLGVSYTSEQRMDNLLKNLLCDQMSQLIKNRPI